MATISQVISDIREINKVFNQDQTLTSRAIYAMLIDAASLLITQKLNRRELWLSDNIFQTIPNLELEQVSMIEACGTNIKKLIRRSKKLPMIATSKFYSAIKGVYTVDYSSELIASSLQEQLDVGNLKYQGNRAYYWIQDNRLMATADVEAVSLVAYFPADAGFLLDNGKECYKPMDREFKVPNDLLQPIKDMVNDRMRIYKVAKDDRSLDGRDIAV